MEKLSMNEPVIESASTNELNMKKSKIKNFSWKSKI